MAMEQVAEALIDALVDQDAHLGTSEQELLCFFEGGDRCFARSGWESFQKVFERLSTFQIVK